MSRSQSIPSPALNREPSASQLSEIRRLTQHVLRIDDWPDRLHPVTTRGEADTVLRTLLSAYGIKTPGHSPDLLEEIKRLQPQPAGFIRLSAPTPPLSLADELARIEKKGRTMRPKLPPIEPDQTWLGWAASITSHNTERACEHCGGTGKALGSPSVPEILGAITGLTSPTLTPQRVRNRLTNPDLETLRRVADLIGGDLELAAEFCGTLVEAFDKHPIRDRRRRSA